jgi:hypothetical protein
MTHRIQLRDFREAKGFFSQTAPPQQRFKGLFGNAQLREADASFARRGLFKNRGFEDAFGHNRYPLTGLNLSKFKNLAC